MSKKITEDEKNKELAELYRNAYELLSGNWDNIVSIGNLIRDSKILHDRTKGILMKRIMAISDNSNSILESLGRLGKVK